MDLQGIDLVLIRGAQGAGKSTLARHLVESHGFLPLEPDEFYHAGPHYFWERSWLRIAHRWNRWRTFRALSMGIKVVVAETFYRKEFLLPYVTMTPHHKVIRVVGEFQNVHEVPQEVVEQVRADMEPYPGEQIIDNRNVSRN